MLLSEWPALSRQQAADDDVRPMLLMVRVLPWRGVFKRNFFYTTRIEGMHLTPQGAAMCLLTSIFQLMEKLTELSCHQQVDCQEGHAVYASICSIPRCTHKIVSYILCVFDASVLCSTCHFGGKKNFSDIVTTVSLAFHVVRSLSFSVFTCTTSAVIGACPTDVTHF